MIKRAAVLLVLMMASVSMLGASISAHNEAEASYLKYVSAWKAKDIPSLDRLIADDYMTLNGESKLANKQSELAEAKDDPPYDRMDVLEIHSLIRGNTAVITGILQADGKSAGANRLARRRVS